MKNIIDWCQWPRCRNKSDMIYLDHGLCNKHWTLISEMESEAAHKKLGIEQGEKDGKYEDSEGRENISGQVEQEQKEI